ncbi:hypothetical protein ABW20_dc0103717 [Dactylellina cionopaga]|nr:hypothetical protein ABW20_dc0103717 [Dactylellina cionopaga]
MKIACLQLDPQLGKVQDNIHRADEILENALGIEGVQDKVDILVLPELAFTVGYPELAVGYQPLSGYARRPKVYDPFSELPIDVDDDDNCTDKDANIQDHSYNACVVTSPDGEVVMNYRKMFLYSTDENWASEGSSFGTLTLTFPINDDSSQQTSPTSSTKSITLALGICMDLNPYQFTAPFSAYEFANHVLSTGAQLAIVPMAWETKDPVNENQLKAFLKKKHDYTVRYWAMRMEPLFGYNDQQEEDTIADEEDDGEETGVDTPVETEGEDEEEETWVKLQSKPKEGALREQEKVVFVTCNRAGKEAGTLFVGSSAVMTIKKKDERGVGSLESLETLGMAEEGLLIVDADL